MHAGSAIDWPCICKACRNKICRNATNDEVLICSNGLNYIAVENTVIAGIVVREYQCSSKARKKQFREQKNSIVSMQMLESAIQAIRDIEHSIEADIEARKSAVVQNYIDKNQYMNEFLLPLKKELLQGLSFVHDYKQVNTRIAQNINVLIETRYKGPAFTDKFELATREERAIYQASKYLDEKLNVAKFLMHPEWLDIRDKCLNSRFHGIVLKYRRIYSPQFEEKNLDVHMLGRSYKEVHANPQAISIIPHTFIDNAAKYSPRNGRLDIYTDDRDGKILFEVSSYGPRILPGEEKKIFQLSFRGEVARREEEEGAGYGLYLCQMIANRHLGTEITFEQDAKQTPSKGHWTTFSVSIPLEAAII
jgi:signal transduction histidine kinase